MEAPLVSSSSRTSGLKMAGIIALAVVGTLAAALVVFNSVPAKTGLVQVSSDSTCNSTVIEQYSAWKGKHNKTFSAVEDAKRFQTFCQNHQKIHEHNKKNLSYSLGHNHFSHLSFEEFKAVYTGADVTQHKPVEHSSSSSTDAPHRILAALPTKVNWTASGAVTPVKNQGSCGSCWSFSSTGALEGFAYIKSGAKKTLYSFSEQQLVDCTVADGNHACNGGWMPTAWSYIIKNKGIAAETTYKYTAKAGTCNTALASKVQWSGFTTTHYVQAGNATAFKAAASLNPVAICLDATALMSYSKGVINGGCGKDCQHAVLMTGYNAADVDKTHYPNGYYIVKNSWGTGWGELGYFRIAIGGTSNDPGVCYVQNWGMYVS